MSEESTNQSNEFNCTANLICIQYPGIVKNLEKAIKTLGGLSEIENVTHNAKKNLELRFRPGNYYCKSAMSEKDTKPTLLVKTTIRKFSDGTKKIINYDVIGLTAMQYKFNKLCDFQFLPLMPKVPVEVEDELEYMYHKVIPEDLPNYDFIFNEADSKDVPLVFVPVLFSKLNSTDNQLHFDRSKFYEGKFTPEYYNSFKEQEMQQKLSKKHKGKSVATYSAITCNFNDKIPNEPPKLCLKTLSTKFYKDESVQKVKKLFEKREIWSKHALLYLTGLSLEQIKFILPTVAYHYVGGPWRKMWVKFGYDPKLDPSARIYQTFDFRVTSKGGLKVRVRARRDYNLDVTQSHLNKFNFGVGEEANKIRTSRALDDDSYFILRPGVLPPARQMLYQYCDVKLPEIEAMIARLPPVLPGTKCSPKDGWLPRAFTAQCREIAYKYIGAQVHKEFLEDKINKDQQNERMEEEQSQNDNQNLELFEISDSSSSSGSDDESDDDVNVKVEDMLDMETVEEVNRMIENTNKNKKSLSMPGPSTSSYLG